MGSDVHIIVTLRMYCIPCAIQFVIIVIVAVVAMVAVVVAALVVGAVVNMAVELLLVDVCDDVMITLKFVVPVSILYFAKVLSEVVVET